MENIPNLSFISLIVFKNKSAALMLKLTKIIKHVNSEKINQTIRIMESILEQGSMNRDTSATFKSNRPN